MGVHDGHRARLKKRFDQEGLDAFQPHEALELLLFHAVSRRDVNPVAHELVEHFGSLNGVLNAGADALNSVSSLGGRAAALLSCLPAFFDVYRAQRAADRPIIKNISAAKAYCRHLTGEEDQGRLWLLHLAAGGGLILAESLVVMDGYPRPRQVLERALSSRAQALVLAERRENAAQMPGDKAFAATLSDLLSMIGVALIDGLILGGERTFSFRREGLLSAPLREASALRLSERGWLGGDDERPVL
jgi:DNA repair protein RadC